MRSHEYEFAPQDLWRFLGLPLIPVAMFALLMHGGVIAGIWPNPRPTLDTDRTILIHQAEASRARHDAEVVLIGDSSCLMDVSARGLGALLGRPVLNLGTQSHLDLEVHATLLREFSAANHGRPFTVVLLMHPEALRRVSSEGYDVAVMQSFLQRTDLGGSFGFSARISCLLGLDIFQGRFWSRWVPSPLRGAYGRHYGFSADLEKFMESQDGSALDPDIQPAQGDAAYRLARTWERPSRAFKTALPPGARLIAGITPAPERFVRANHQTQCAAMLEEWGGWLNADALLTELGFTQPDPLFAKTTHLNQEGVRVYTRRLAEQLKPLLR